MGHQLDPAGLLSIRGSIHILKDMSMNEPRLVGLELSLWKLRFAPVDIRAYSLSQASVNWTNGVATVTFKRRLEEGSTLLDSVTRQTLDFEVFDIGVDRDFWRPLFAAKNLDFLSYDLVSVHAEDSGGNTFVFERIPVAEVTLPRKVKFTVPQTDPTAAVLQSIRFEAK
jgi:hypothetical protein